jgi:hypothetical protein
MILRVRYLVKLTIVFACVSLGGCLTGGSSDTPDSAESPNPPESQPPSTNSAPTISGSPSSAVNVGATYTFLPTASDPDGDALTFSISNKPAWAEFDSSTGAVSGVPSLGDVGNYSNIMVTVSDGQANASLSQFSVEVTQVQPGSVTLSWTAPTQNSDGSALTNLASYNIYYGVSPGHFPNQRQINNPGVTTYVVDNLAPNTYYFVATAVNSQGIESQFSNSTPVTVN